MAFIMIFGMLLAAFYAVSLNESEDNDNKQD